MKSNETKTETMTVSKALRLAKTLKGQLSTLTSRANESFNWEEGNGKKAPNFKFSETIDERVRTANKLSQLKAAIAKSNCMNNVRADGVEVTMQEAIFKMAELKSEKDFFENLRVVDSESSEFRTVVVSKGKSKGQLGQKEYKRVFKSALTEKERLAKVDALQKRIDSLNDVLETNNHTATVTV